MIKVFGQIRVKRLTGVARISTSSVAKITLEDRAVTPTAEEQILEAGKGFDGLGVVTVLGDPNFIAKNIKMGVKIWGVEGIYAGGLPIVAKVAAEVVPIYSGTARSLGINANNMNFDSHATGVLYTESE